MTAADRLMAPRQSSPYKLLIVVLHANREHRRDAYATLGSAKCLTPRASHGSRGALFVPTGRACRHSQQHLASDLCDLRDLCDLCVSLSFARVASAEAERGRALKFTKDTKTDPGTRRSRVGTEVLGFE